MRLWTVFDCSLSDWRKRGNGVEEESKDERFADDIILSERRLRHHLFDWQHHKQHYLAGFFRPTQVWPVHSFCRLHLLRHSLSLLARDADRQTLDHLQRFSFSDVKLYEEHTGFILCPRRVVVCGRGSVCVVASLRRVPVRCIALGHRILVVEFAGRTYVYTQFAEIGGIADVEVDNQCDGRSVDEQGAAEAGCAEHQIPRVVPARHRLDGRFVCAGADAFVSTEDGFLGLVPNLASRRYVRQRAMPVPPILVRQTAL